MKDIHGVEIQVGDKVLVTETAASGSLHRGYTGVVTSVNPSGSVTVDNSETGRFWDYNNNGGKLEILKRKYPNPPHKHAEVIKAWADGADIEFRGNRGKWESIPEPSWGPSFEYRVKPQLSPQEIEKLLILEEIAKLQGRLDKLKEDSL